MPDLDQLGSILGLIPPGLWWLLGGAFVVYVLFVALSGGSSGSRHRDAHRVEAAEREQADVWATRRDLRELIQHRKEEPDPRRQLLGYLLDKGEKVVSEPMGSVMLIAPTRSGKSASYVVPDVLEHHGPQVVTSVKTDVKQLTQDWVGRDERPVWTFDPSESSGTTCRWSPLADVHNWADALNAAKWLQDSSKIEKRSTEDREFWDANARKVLAPLLLLAAERGDSMRHVVTWSSQIAGIEHHLARDIDALGVPEAYDYWVSYQGLADKTKSSVAGTLFIVMEAWAHPHVARAVDVSGPPNEVFRVADLIDQGGTLYMVAPASQQALFTPIYETLVNAIIMDVERRYARTNQPVHPPLHLCLDEAANIAPLRNLDKVASAGAGIGIKLKSVWQDEAQLVDIYGAEKARTIMSNHINKVYFAGITDPSTLRTLSEIIGDALISRDSSSTDSTGRRSQSDQYVSIRVAPPAWIRQLPQGEVLVISRNVKPMHLYTIPWYRDKRMRERINDEVAAQFDAYYAPQKRRKGRVLVREAN